MVLALLSLHLSYQCGTPKAGKIELSGICWTESSMISQSRVHGTVHLDHKYKKDLYLHCALSSNSIAALVAMAVKLILAIEVSCHGSRCIKTCVYTRALRGMKRSPLLKANTPRPHSGTPLFWCSGVSDEYDAWPGPPPYFATSPLPNPQVFAVPLSELEVKSTWIREMRPKVLATTGSMPATCRPAENTPC